MTGTADLQLQAAIISALKANAGVTGLVGQRVYGYPRAKATWPYITLGDDIERPYDTNTEEGSEVTATVNVWCKGPTGRSTSKAIGAAVRSALHRNVGKTAINAALVGHACVNSTFISKQTVSTQVKGHGNITQAIVRFRVVTQSTA